MIGFFNGQTEYNYLENSIPLDKYVLKCKEYGYDFASITDKNMHGYFKFYKLCKKNNIVPIIGLKIQLSNSIILIYAKNDLGLKSLFKLSKLQEEKKLTDEIFFNFTENIFIVTNYENKINQFINDKKYDDALTEIKKYKDFDLYIGLENKDDSFHIKNNLKTVPISNVAYLDKEDVNVYKTLIKISNSDEKKCNHIKSIDELKKDVNLHSLDFVNKINYSNIEMKIKLPIYDSNIDSQKYLYDLASKGLNRRLQLLNKTNQLKKYTERLTFELNVINTMGYNDYFLIVWDLIKYAKKSGILVGPGRGSAAGSLVSYCLGITEIDPIAYNLYFERFLNPQRVTMPDIDIDFPDDKRDDIIKYVQTKYGENHVCYISAFNTFGIKSSIRDICRVNNVKLDHVNLMLKHIEQFGIDDALEKYSSRDDLIEILTIANKINGLIRHISTHAAGIIISSIPLDEYTPLRVGVNDVYQAQLEGKDLESIGFLKIDFLGIRNLTLVDNMCKNLNLKLSEIKLNDKKTFELLSNGDTNGIFQLESNGIKNVLRKLKPNCFDDIVSVLALYRPGPMENIDEYIKRRFDKKVTYLCKELEPILKSTNGIIVYQEQIMEIANVISNYSYAEADLLRRAISKKDKNLLDENRTMFVSKAEENGYSKTISNSIYDLIVKFADYGFNKSHSVAYAMLSYQMAYLKANSPITFISEMINNSIADKEEMKFYIKYAKSKGIDVVTPKINHSLDECVIIKNRILLPFQSINKLGNSIAKQIVKERDNGKFTSFENFKSRTPFLNESNITNLIYASSLDEFNITKKNMLKKSDDLFSKYLKDKIEEQEEFDFEELKTNEIEALSFNINYDIFKNNELKIKKYKTVQDIDSIKENAIVKVVAYVDSIKEIETKNKEKMAFVDLDLNFTKISAVVFPSNYTVFNNLDFNKLIYMEVSVQKRNEELQLVINKSINI